MSWWVLLRRDCQKRLFPSGPWPMAGESAHASHPGARAAIPRAPFAFVRVRCGECRVSLSLVSVSEWSYFCTFSSFPALRRRLPHLLSQGRRIPSTATALSGHPHDIRGPRLLPLEARRRPPQPLGAHELRLSATIRPSPLSPPPSSRPPRIHPRHYQMAPTSLSTKSPS